MRDIVVVRTPTLGAVLYAALEYGRVVEVRLPSGPVSELNLGGYFVERVAAATDGGDEVVVAVGMHNDSGIATDTAAPYRTTGVWSDMCITSGVPDKNNVNVDTVKNNHHEEIRFLSRNATQGLAPQLLAPIPPTGHWWGSLDFVPGSTPSSQRLYASTSVSGFEGFHVKLSSTPLVWNVASLWSTPFNGLAFAAGDCTVSLRDNDILGTGRDGWNQISPGDMMEIVGSGASLDLRSIANTSSACPDRSEPFPPYNCSSDPLSTDPRLRDPLPFTLQSAGTANWLDPYDPSGQSEWYLSGTTTYWHVDPTTCAWFPDSMNCRVNPCLPPAPTRSPWGKGKKIPGAGTDVGWMLTRLRTGAPPIGPQISGLDMAMSWWQLPSPNVSGDLDRSLLAPFTTATADPRTHLSGAVQVPDFMYLVRNGAMTGVKFVLTEWLMNRAVGAPSACAAGTSGYGEALGSPVSPQPGWGPSDLQILSAWTHLELRNTSPCSLRVTDSDCDEPTMFTRVAFNQKAHVFSIPWANETAPHWIVAVACGFITTGDDPVNVLCPWLPYRRRALTVFYDVTSLAVTAMGAWTPPVLLAAAVGPNPVLELPLGLNAHASESHAFSVRTQVYGTGPAARTYAFVGDLLGRVLVYDVSYDSLVQSTPTIPMPDNPTLPLLEPTQIHRFPADPFDGRRPNCTDIEFDNKIAYCAVSRDGVILLDVHTIVPMGTNFPVVASIDTPGVATGIAFRTNALGQRQMLVGDNRCGLRLYGRLGQ